jgi:nucleoside-diphosphate-sugar epimerase
MLPHAPARLVYLSTTGIYGNRNGERVNETSEPHPESARAERRLAAERILAEWCIGRHTTALVLRVPGIYGPGRLGTDSIRASMPVLEEKDANPGNRIHVDDLATCCIAALSPDVRDGVYNVGDGDHRSGTWFTNEVARQAGLPPPPTISLAEARKTFSPMRLSFLRESRIVDTTKMREVLGVIPKYADAADGIAASLAEEETL